MPAPFPKVLGNGFLGKTAMAVNQLLIHVSRSMFSYQIFVVAEATPDVDFILEDARRRSELRDRAATADSDEATSVEQGKPAPSRPLHMSTSRVVSDSVTMTDQPTSSTATSAMPAPTIGRRSRSGKMTR